MTNEDRAVELRKLMRKHGLTYAEVAEMADAAVKTVEGWLATPGAASHRGVPKAAMSLIRLRLAAREKTKK